MTDEKEIKGFTVHYRDESNERFDTPISGDGAIFIANTPEGIHVRGHGTSEQMAIMLFTFMSKEGHEDIVKEFASCMKAKIDETIKMGFTTGGSKETH